MLAEDGIVNAQDVHTLLLKFDKETTLLRTMGRLRPCYPRVVSNAISHNISYKRQNTSREAGKTFWPHAGTSIVDLSSACYRVQSCACDEVAPAAAPDPACCEHCHLFHCRSVEITSYDNARPGPRGIQSEYADAIGRRG